METNDFYEGSASLKMNGQKLPSFLQFIKIDPTKRYRLSGCFKSVGTGGLSRIYFGYQPYDSQMRSIDQTMSDHFSDRETVISQQLNSGDSTVYINSVNNFTIGHFSRLGIYPFEDYPEYTYTRNFVTFNSIDPGNNSLSLSSPYSGNTLLVGTKVAQLKSSYGTYMYSTAEGSLVPNQ